MWKKFLAWMASWTAKFKQQRSFQTLISGNGFQILAGCLVGAVIGFFFYRDWYLVLGVAVLGGIFVPKELNKMVTSRAKIKIGREFSSFVERVSTSLSAGRSLENALVLTEISAKESPFLYSELSRLQKSIKAGLKFEECFEAFTLAIGLEEARELMDVLFIARKSGGNLPRIFRDSGRLIRERLEMEEELKLSLLRQQLEQKLLFLMPFVVLGLLLWMSPTYLSPLYETLTGRLIMTGALTVMVLSYWLSKKWMDVRV